MVGMPSVAPAVTAAAATSVAVLAAVGARPTELLDVAGWRQRLAADPTQALALGAETVVWLLLAWLAVAVAVSAASALPGRAGTRAERVARRVSPLLVRRAVAGLLGAGLALGVGVTAASAAPSVGSSGPAFPRVAAALALPAEDSGDGQLALDLPAPGEPIAPRSASAPSAPQAPAPLVAPPPSDGPGAAATPASEVVVAPGDCLWDLAARSLGPRASTTAITAEWPRWWHSNAGVIGADPDLIHPGQHLHPPAAPSQP